MLPKLTAGALGLLVLLALINYVVNDTGLPGETWQLLTIIMDTASLGVGVLISALPIFIIAVPIFYLLANIGSKK